MHTHMNHFAYELEPVGLGFLQVRPLYAYGIKRQPEPGFCFVRFSFACFSSRHLGFFVLT